MWGPLVLAGDLGPGRERGRGRGAASATGNNPVPRRLSLQSNR